MKSLSIISLTLVLLVGCATPKSINLEKIDLPNGNVADIYTLNNGRGLIAKISSYGGVILSLETIDRYGDSDDVLLGFDDFDQYLNQHAFYNGMLGRYADRIADASFSLDDKEFKLSDNDNGNTLNGGSNGFNTIVWDARSYTNNRAEPTLELKHLSIDGENGFPGYLSVVVRYSLTKSNGLKIQIDAGCDKPTVVNLGQRLWFNLAHMGECDILDHYVSIQADNFLPVDKELIPSGEIKAVNNSPFDFTRFRTIANDILKTNAQLENAQGYNHSWILDKNDDEFILAAKVYEPIFGRFLEVWTTQPVINFNTGGSFDSSETGKNNKVIRKGYAFSLMPQKYPNAPNQTNFPAVVLFPGKKYQETTIYKFSAKKQFSFPMASGHSKTKQSQPKL